ncbi:MAG: ABC transporter permease [Candidatus Aminicenantaceae bacterium]
MTQNINPPRFSSWLLSRMSQYQSQFSWLGDLEEEFRERVTEQGALRAGCWFRTQVFRSLPAYLRYSLVWSLIMFKNYFKTAVRNLNRFKGFSLINLLGLAIGMACCILIFLWVQDELSFDRFHRNADSLHRVLLNPAGTDSYWYHGPGPLGPALKREYPEIADTCRVFGHARAPLRYGNQLFTCRVQGVDPSFFDMFSFPLLAGGPENPLSDRQSLVLTESTARKLFGEDDPLDKTVSFEWWGTWHDFRVTAVMGDVPSNSLFEYEVLLPFNFVTLSGMTIDKWDVSAYVTYVLLQPEADAASVSDKIAGTITRNLPTERYDLSLYPMTRIHLYEPEGGGPILYVYIFSCIGLLILIMACINFINLTTARSEKRAREVGLRKVVGAVRSQLIRQFLGESMLLAAIACAAAVILVIALLPSANTVMEKQLTFSFNTGGLALLLGIVLLTGLAAGLYPALFLSAYQPAGVLKGAPGTRARKPLLRKVLVVTQFTISVLLLIATTSIYQQLNFMRHKDMGLNTDQVINMELRGGLRTNYRAIKTRLLQHPGIRAVSATNGSFFKRFGTTGVSWEGKDPNDDGFFSIHAVDYDYSAIFDLEMAQGRYFSREFPTDADEAIIVNEAAVAYMGLEDPLGQRIYCPLPFDGDRSGLIVGVVKDFHYRSLHEEIRPLVLAVAPGWFTDMYVRIQPDDPKATVGFIENTLKELAPDFPLEYTFLNADIDRLYKEDSRIGSLVRYGAALAVFIAGLGLFGLASFTAEQRTKEIGVRKVLGSSVREIVLLLTRDISRWVGLANLIAWPLAYLAVNAWLKSFAYRTDIGISIFLLTGLATLAVAFFSVAYQSLRAARANPVDSLRYE